MHSSAKRPTATAAGEASKHSEGKGKQAYPSTVCGVSRPVVNIWCLAVAVTFSLKGMLLLL
jgi:hypothetical protein